MNGDTALHLRHNVSRSRYEAEMVGEVAVNMYARDGDILTFTHTSVPGPIEGLGVVPHARRLVTRALEGRA